MALEQYRPSSRFNLMPPITKNIIIINVIMFLVTWYFRRPEPETNPLYDLFALHYYESDKFHVWQFITHMFLHADWMHIFFNMFAVWMFGTAIENMWGPKRYLNYYLLTGLGAALAHTAVTYYRLQQTFPQVASPEEMDVLSKWINDSYALGASGAVFGILIAFGMYFPNTLLFIIPFPFPVKAKYFVVIYGLIELFLGVRNITGDEVAHFAHLGGLVSGFLIIQVWKRNDRTYY